MLHMECASNFQLNKPEVKPEAETACWNMCVYWLKNKDDSWIQVLCYLNRQLWACPAVFLICASGQGTWSLCVWVRGEGKVFSRYTLNTFSQLHCAVVLMFLSLHLHMTSLTWWCFGGNYILPVFAFITCKRSKETPTLTSYTAGLWTIYQNLVMDDLWIGAFKATVIFWLHTSHFPILTLPLTW